MFGIKWKKGAGTQQPETEQTSERPGDSRKFSEAIGNAWLAATGQNPADLIPQVIATVLQAGGTRRAWQWKRAGREYIFMAWPADQPIRAGVLMAGPDGQNLTPVDVVPLLEGTPNDFTIHSIHERRNGMGADVAVEIMEGKNPMWFFDPFYGRDRDDLTPGVTHTFWLGALAFGVREALLDEITITNGPRYETWAETWLQENPGKKRIDVPPLKISIEDMPLIMPGRFFGEYEIRGVIEEMQDCQFEKMPVKILYLSFPFEDRHPLHLPLFVSQHVLGDYKPEKGDEIEAYAWFQGRIIDLDAAPTPETGQSATPENNLAKE